MQRIGIGSIGGLAVAAGIGAALAAAAPAWADSTATGESSTAAPMSHSGAAVTAARRPSTQRASLVRATSSRATARAGSRPPAPPAAQTGNVTPVKAVPGLSIRRSGQGPVLLPSRSTKAAELSGIAYGDGTTYYAVGDNGASSIWTLYTSLDGRNGRIRSALVSGGISAPGLGRDSEGITVAPDRTSVWVSDEIASSITRFGLATGIALDSVGVPAIFRPANVQNNMGLESLSYGAGKLWTANEEALRPDGALSTTAAGSWVRIQRFGGPDFTPEKQYAYLTDPITAMSPFTAAERSGLVDLLALPNGDVLALERELGGFLPMFRTRIYLLDFVSATDVADVPSLSSGGFTAVTKTLLWQSIFAFRNFEGITLGPELVNGAYPLLLVSDNGSGDFAQRQDIVSLTLQGLPV